MPIVFHQQKNIRNTPRLDAQFTSDEGSPWGKFPFQNEKRGGQRCPSSQFRAISILPPLDLSPLSGKEKIFLFICFAPPKACHADSCLGARQTGAGDGVRRVVLAVKKQANPALGGRKSRTREGVGSGKGGNDMVEFNEWKQLWACIHSRPGNAPIPTKPKPRKPRKKIKKKRSRGRFHGEAKTKNSANNP